MTRLLFVCLGNICRSPTAEAVTRALVGQRQLEISVDSAGTGAWHVGNPPDRRMQAAASAAGYDMSSLRARQVTARDFQQFDIIYAMDRQNQIDLERIRPTGAVTPVRLFLEASGLQDADVPDPYYEGGFDSVVTLIERGSAALLDTLPR